MNSSEVIMWRSGVKSGIRVQEPLQSWLVCRGQAKTVTICLTNIFVVCTVVF